MTKAEAFRIVGRAAPWELQNMCKALAMHSWLNTAEEWQRFEAAATVLGKRCPPRARAVLNAHNQFWADARAEVEREAKQEAGRHRLRAKKGEA